MTIEGVAFDGPLSGCTVCADVNGNGGCDGFEPSTTTNSTGGYTVEVTAAQRAVMLAEDGSLLLPQSTRCIDSHTGLAQLYQLTGRHGATAINPFTTMATTLPASAPTTAASRLAGPTRIPGRRKLTFEQQMVSLRNVMAVTQTRLIQTIDLAAFDPYSAIATGRDICLASEIAVRSAQTQSAILQLATIRQVVTNPTANLSVSAAVVVPALADKLVSVGYSQMAIPAFYVPLFPPGLTGPVTNALKTALAASYNHLESSITACPMLDLWQARIMALHNMKRADHCTQPMIWDEALAASAASHAGGCPLSMDTHSTIANVSENVVHAATPSDDPEAVVETLFQSWYDQQLPNYGFATALGPCPGGFRYQTAAGSECIATGANRVEELTRLLWGSHNIMGCAYRGCAVGKVLVCHYSKRDCTGGSDCVGNVPDQFQANVRAVNPYGPGPCTQRAWDDITETSVRSYATQAHTPAEIRRLLANTIDPATFVESTSTAGLTNASNIATIPVREPLPPSPPWAGAPPSLPITTGGSAVTTEDGAAPDASWVWILIFILCLVLLLLCCCYCTLYRMSGGEPELWLKTHYSHRNKAIFGYASEDDQAKAAADLAICQKAMGDAFATYPSILTAYYYMRRDHKNWILAGGIDEARKGVVVDYQPPYAEKPSKPKPAIAQPKAVDAPAKLLPDGPSIDADLDAEFAESPEDRTRRIEWIKYYVREGDLQKAFDLGWDGKPFRQDKVVKSPSGSAGSDAGSDDTPPAGKASAAVEGAGATSDAERQAMHRI